MNEKHSTYLIIFVVIMYFALLLIGSSNANMRNQIIDLKNENEALRREVATCNGQMEDIIYTYESMECVPYEK